MTSAQAATSDQFAQLVEVWHRAAQDTIALLRSVDEGEWAVPTEESMIECLRIAFRSRSLGRLRGEYAAERAREFPWERTGNALVRVLEIVESRRRNDNPLGALITAGNS